MSQNFQLLGIGLGPANLALAALAEERGFNRRKKGCLFLDKKPTFSWHQDMLIPGAQLQVPFIRDLATVRNPRSPFTFLNYLKEVGKLDQFINLRTFYPLRKEFHSYFEWVCNQLSHFVKFNYEVQQIMPVQGEGGKTIRKLKVQCFNVSQQKSCNWLCQLVEED
jgi:L-ornithine N5-oxygenase